MLYLQPQTVAAMGAEWFAYTQRFTVAAAQGGNAGTQGSGVIPIQSSGPFFMEMLTIAYPTVLNDGATDVDDGVSRLRLQLKNSSNNLPVFSDFIPVELFATPGRRATPGVVSAYAPGTLQLGTGGFPLYALFPTSGNIGFDWQNDANVPAVVDVACWGWLLNKEIVPDGVAFSRILRENQVSAPWVDGA